MDNQPGTLRRVHAFCKLDGRLRLRAAAGVHALAIAGTLCTSSSGLGCRARPAERYITIDELAQAPTVRPQPLVRSNVTEVAQLREMCAPLGPWLGLIQVRSPAEWRLVQQAVGGLSFEPDFRTGCVLGLICWSGTRIAGGWPVAIEAIQATGGAGLLQAEYAGGNFYPDGSAAIDLVYVSGPIEVLVVDVDGVLYYPGRTTEFASR